MYLIISQNLKIALTGWLGPFFDAVWCGSLLPQLPSSLTMVAADSPEIFEYIYQTYRRHILEDDFLHSLRHENFEL